MKKGLLIIIFIFIMLLTGCKKEIEWEDDFGGDYDLKCVHQRVDRQCYSAEDGTPISCGDNEVSKTSYYYEKDNKIYTKYEIVFDNYTQREEKAYKDCRVKKIDNNTVVRCDLEVIEDGYPYFDTIDNIKYFHEDSGYTCYTK